MYDNDVIFNKFTCIMSGILVNILIRWYTLIVNTMFVEINLPPF